MRLFIFLSILIILSACTGGKVVHFTNSKSDFLNYQNYKFRNIEKDSFNLTGVGIFNAIKTSIQFEMKDRGYTESQKNSDLLIHFDLISSYGESTNNGFNPNNPINNYNAYFFDTGRQTDNINKSVLLIELFDLKRRKTSLASEFGSFKFKARKKT